ncbi:MAG: type II toxin-antitoxin system VapC family toxin [Chloroflexi bacterium]|nr:type II toxin-antitoxin system VapC family toxin [Chloroflexota bacterium]
MAVSQLIIDTDIIIDYLRRRAHVLESALRQYECGITAITWYELNAIPTHSPRQQRLLGEFGSLLSIYPFDFQAAIEAAIVWRRLQQQGLKIGVPDTLIAGICLANSLPLLTKNSQHFKRIDGLVVLTPEQIAPA